MDTLNLVLPVALAVLLGSCATTAAEAGPRTLAAAAEQALQGAAGVLAGARPTRDLFGPADPVAAAAAQAQASGAWLQDPEVGVPRLIVGPWSPLAPLGRGEEVPAVGFPGLVTGVPDVVTGDFGRVPGDQLALAGSAVAAAGTWTSDALVGGGLGRDAAEALRAGSEASAPAREAAVQLAERALDALPQGGPPCDLLRCTVS